MTIPNSINSTRSRSKLAIIIPFVVVGAFALAIYAYVLKLPFFRDDMVMLLWLRDMSWSRLWVDATGFPYYRPLSFSTLKLSELVFGWPEPISLHVLNLALHAANSVFVVLLAQRFFEGKGKRIAAISAGLLFAAYPFTYEIVPTTGPIFQLQAAFFGLSAALCYAKFRDQTSDKNQKSKIKNQGWLWLSLALALMGAFTCEYGVIIPLFIVLVELMCRMKSTPVPLLYFGFAALYLATWVLVPKSRAEPPLILQGLTPALRDMPVTALYYLQGLTYPFQTLAWPLVRATGMSQRLAVGLIAALTLAGSVALFAWARRLPLLAFALAWFLVAVAPMWPTLNADYTLNGPRLHYLPSIGTTLVWGSIIAILIADRRSQTGVNRLRSVVGGVLLAVTLLQSLVFLHGMADIITIGSRITADVSRAVAATPSNESSLVINFPAWIGKRGSETTFALGAEGISFLPGYSTMRDLVRLNTQQNRDVKEVTFTNTIQEWKYDQRLGLLVNWNKLTNAIRAAKHVWAIEYLPNTLQLSEAGSVQSAKPPEPEVTFDKQIGLKVQNVALTPDGLRIELTWTTTITVDRQLTAFVHVYNPQGKLVAQQDGYPLLGHYPPWLEQANEVVHDVRRIALSTGQLAAGHYVVGVGVYDAETGQRVPAISPAGGRFENDVYLFYGFDIKRSDRR